MTHPHRIHIFGASGSGTTTLAKSVSTALGCAHFDADDYFWEDSDPPYQRKTSKPARIAKIRGVTTSADSWVLSGCIAGWGEWIKPQLTLSVFVSLNQQTRIERLVAREVAEYGARIDPGGDLRESHLEFIEWATSYDSAAPPVRSLRLHDQWIEEMRCPVIRLNSEEAVSSLTERVIAATSLKG